MTRHIQKILICAGSRTGARETYMEHAQLLGRDLGRNAYDVCYGGGQVGLMGAVALGARDAGAAVHGYIPGAFHKAAGADTLEGITQEGVDTLFIRKEKMLASCDAAIVLPGGIGTLDEWLEVAAHNDIGRYIDSETFIKPVLILNIDGFFDPMKEQLENSIAEGFMDAEMMRMFHFLNHAGETAYKLECLNTAPLPGARLFSDAKPA